MSIDALYKKIRDAVRNLAHRESLYVVWAYSQFLQLPDFRIPHDIEVARPFVEADLPQGMLAEWTLEQIAREVIRQADEEPRKGQSLRRWSTLAFIANALRDLEGEIYAQLVGGTKIHLELMRISHRQFVWQQQRYNWRWIIRYYKLFKPPQIDTLCQQATGLDVDKIFLIGLLYLGMFVDHSRAMQRPRIQIPGLTQEHIDRFLKLTSLSRAELSARLRTEHALDEGFAYRYSSLREFPLVRISYLGNDEVACPIPTLLFWRITTGLYYALKEEKGFPTAFGGSFESYVGDVLRCRITSEAMAVLEEAEYRVGRLRKDTVDWIIQQGDRTALFI